MDPSLYSRYTTPNGLPQESKLAKYMNHSIVAPTRSLTQAMAEMTFEPQPSTSREYVPIGYFPTANILQESPQNSPPNNLAPVPSNTQIHQENVGGTTYFYRNSETMNASVPLNSSALIGPQDPCLAGVVGGAGPSCTTSAYAPQMYAGIPQHMGAIIAKPGLAASFYTPETIRSEMYQRNEDVFLQPDLHQFPNLPEHVEMFSELTPLEHAIPHAMATSFRATHRQTGEHYALRRLHSYAGAPTQWLDAWKQIDHPNIVRLNDYFTTSAFGDHSMVLVYDYHPSYVTVMTQYLASGNNVAADANGAYHDPFSSDPDAPRPYTHQKNAMLRAVASGALLPEAVLWSLLIQLTAALRTIHAAGLACRSLDPTKVVMHSCRLRVSWCGAMDALTPNSCDLAQAQQDDLLALGRLVLALACRSAHCCDNIQASIDIVSRSYSLDLKNVILYLLTTPTNRRCLIDLMPMIGGRFYTQVEALERRADVFENQIAREMDNARLLRIMMKLGIINERPELNMDSSWSETGHRYMLKLFRDYLFHSVSTDGRPWIDQAHIVHCLNQLDGGTDAKVELMSRDEQSVLVVSYAELKHCLEQSYDEVMQAAAVESP